jgi:hypothetical protein
MNDDDSFTNGCYVDSAGNSALAFHAHLPKRTLKMFYIGLADLLKAVRLNQLYNALETGATGNSSSASLTSSFKNSTSHAIWQYYPFFAMSVVQPRISINAT